ncbi:branched-chain amino acid aminotransferase [Marivita sp.]|uniref:branched-chain amino acid aminotransferase n=1 Tax=Marivita sp. TaxID=2003365 RepID=UPI0026239B83|nr:branched-chain amino acid aminotransferase [Marivita sp.]
MTEKNIWTYWRGDWHFGDTRVLAADSHATWLGSAVFDGARLFDGVAPDLDLHAARVNASALALGLKPTLTGAEIEGLTHDGLAKFEFGTDVYIRPMYWAEDSDVGVLPPDPESTDFALCLEAMPMAKPGGFTATVTKFRRPTMEVMPVNAKAACLYANNARMVREAQSRGFQNALVCDANGNVAELATSNVFMVRGGEVFTPVPNGTFLNGITRQRITGLLRDAGVAVHEVNLTVDDFHEAEEIFSSGNISKVVPVIGFEGRDVPAGPIAAKARALYWDWAHATGGAA